MLKHMIFQPIFLLILSFGMITGNLGAQQNSEIISYARQYRLDPTLSSEQEQTRLKEILSVIYQKLPQYNQKDDLKGNIKDFVSHALSEVNGLFDFTLIDIRTTDFYGKSHDLVFLVQDLEGHLRYVVKAFQDPTELSGRLLPEISAMELIREMQFPNILPIEPIAYAISHEKNNRWGLLLESAAPGQRLDQYVLSISKNRAPKEHEQAFNVAKTAFKRTGESLALLHSVKSGEKLPLNSSILSKYDEKVTQLIKNSFIIEELTKSISLSQLLSYLEEVKNAAKQVPLFYTYAHSDTNLGNIFYDEVTDAISFIDLYALQQSVDIKGNPLADQTMDLIRIEDSLRKKAVNSLTEEEVESLLSCFYAGYEAFGGTAPEHGHLLFYKTFISLRRLILGSNYLKEKDPIRRAFDKTAFEEELEYLIKVTKNQKT